MRIRRQAQAVGASTMCARAVAVAIVALLCGGRASAGAEPTVADAAKRHDTAAMRTLVSGGKDVNVPLRDGATALHWAVEWDDADAVELLLRAGAAANARNDYGVTPLSLALLESERPHCRSTHHRGRRSQ